MNNMRTKWKYAYLTTEMQIEQFEYDSAILKKRKFTQKVRDIILNLKNLNTNAVYDIEFMSWMTEDSTAWEMSKDFSYGILEDSLRDESFEYLHPLLTNLFAYHNFFPQHQKYHFIDHGYPVELNIQLTDFSKYIVFKEYEEIYETVKVSNHILIEEILYKLSLQKLPISMSEYKLRNDSVIILQGEND